jgi:hypothetical protein
MLDKRTITVFPQLSTELILSYSGNNLNLAAGIAGDSEIARPTKLASYFLLQKRRCYAQNYASASAAYLNFCTFGRGAEKARVFRLTRNPKWSNDVAG